MEILSSAQFYDVIHNRGESPHGRKHVVVDFHAQWCGPCKRFAPTFEKMSEKYGKHIYFCKVDVDQLEDVTATYEITSLPSFVITDTYKEGGERPEHQLIVGTDEAELDAALKAIFDTEEVG